MKKLFATAIAVMALFAATLVARADNDKPITVKELPAKAQTLIKKYFSAKKVALAKKEAHFFGSNYDVIFTDGNKLEFDKNGDWTEVDCKHAAVPAEIVPSQIAAYVKENYPDASVVSIEKDSNSYDVKLSNRVEIEFDKQFRVVDVDLD